MKEKTYSFMNETPRRMLERRIAIFYGLDSNAIRAMDLVKKEMCAEKGFCRNDGQDYYNHPINVANTLISFQIKDEDVICAALLHDIVEDVEGYTEQTLEALFNQRVSKYVMLVTKSPDKDYKNPDVLQEYIANIENDMAAAVIKTADVMHNMMTLERKTFDARYRKAMETERFYLPFFKECRERYPRYENLFYAARTQIEPLIFEIKTSYEEIESLRRENEQLRKKLEQK